MSKGSDLVQDIAKKVTDPELLEAEKILNGGDDYSKVMMYRYLLKIMDHTPVHTPAAYRFCTAAERALPTKQLEEHGFPNAKRAECKTPKKQDKKTYHDAYGLEHIPPANAVMPDDWDAIRAYLHAELKATEEVETPAVLQNLWRLSDYLGLNDIDKDVLEFLFVAENHTLDNFLSVFANGESKVLAPVIARALDQPKQFKAVQRVIGEESPLIKYGLFHYGAGTIGKFIPEADYDLWHRLDANDISEELLLGSILGNPTETKLTYEDFAHIGHELQFIVDVVTKAAEQQQKGINILLWGPPGGGKTELAKMLAGNLGLKMYAAGEDDAKQKEHVEIYDLEGDPAGSRVKDKSEEKTSKKRLAQLMRAQGLLKGNKKAVILFDEIEDLLLKGTDTDKKADTDSKIQINRLLETNPVVTIWTGNDTDKFHESVRDRFTYALFIDYPPTLVRKRMWERQLMLQNVELSDDEVLNLARKYDATPRQIGKAVRLASITGTGLDAIEKSIPASAKVSYRSSSALSSGGRISQNFTPGLLNIEGQGDGQGMRGLIEKGSVRKPFSLMVKGEYGTGVNTMLRYMGEQMTMNVLEVPMAALAQPTQFSTPEMNVLSAFSSAVEGNSFLVIKDIQDLVPDPKSASAQWSENSLVDTFLRCASAHKLPFAVTCQDNVSLPEKLEYLFSHQMQLNTLDEEKTRAAYKVFFGMDVPEEMSVPQGLVLSDFSNTKRNLARQQSTQDVNSINKMLEKEKKFRGEGSLEWGFASHLK